MMFCIFAFDMLYLCIIVDPSYQPH